MGGCPGRNPGRTWTLQILLSLASVYAGFGLIFILNGYLAEHLDLEGFGDIQVAFSVSAFLGTILVLGGGAGAGKFLPVYMQARRFAEAKGYLQTHFKQTIILSLGLLVISGSLGLTFHLLGMERLELRVVLLPRAFRRRLLVRVLCWVCVGLRRTAR